MAGTERDVSKGSSNNLCARDADKMFCVANEHMKVTLCLVAVAYYNISTSFQEIERYNGRFLTQ